MSDKHNEQNRPRSFEEEMQFISEIYAERLNKTDNPQSGSWRRAIYEDNAKCKRTVENRIF